MKSLPEVLNDNRDKFALVISQLEDISKLLPISFGPDNSELAGINYSDITQFSNYIKNKIDNQQKLAAYGGYLEDRAMYYRSRLFKSGCDVRTIHLGIDIWAAIGTPVMAFYEGTVHNFGINDAHGDYGGVVVLEHELQGHTFYTLYGHLSHKSVKGKSKGKKIKTGETFAFVGSPSENGYWPPHLHVQIIRNFLSYDLDFPGVCTPNSVNYFEKVCPDPSVILGLP
ncbi:MAG TPA: peptidoglycan DD-metalloendopeptidase family protein [Salinivirgaceae bacterium]|nr:peptidoglycan DD-metalloendopeptidase family protein [Salinivirgaceae bacterium]HQA76650.1 peptidoglycan DD-metalloendopeptidase family protein [Salinivirgaceae bacterium]